MARKRRGIPIHGWLNIDKDAGLSSAQVVGRVKRITDAAKVGHAGTLDPFATGVLPIALGEATKTVGYIFDETKEYRFTARWGEARNTDDIEGEIEATSEVRPTRGNIDAILPAFTGTIRQRPPAYSAIKIRGERAYKRARAGEQLDMPERDVHIESLKLVDMLDDDHAVFEVICGKGTYIRSLARDMALKLGTVAHLTALRRTRVGPFSEKDAISLDKLAELWQCPAEFEDLLPLTTALDDIPALAATEEQACRLRHGNDVAVPNQADGIVCAMDGNIPIGIAKIEAGRLYPVRIFNI
ncbi:tRNA pseudouridine(55) synthase TruB [Sneathiella chungangensis]|uniref:tRNA pseudouridine synthase B n=1 Tax=Sneathiella chungangensis TaxID=1418234 RepID=A0A845MKF9_9PROT|nr:tRNA pseudouridine(55) synthase TruB [Sneathiella chungangensis]MZR23860.1 tRNA pseudouridine(55) synthase TruB [Sneathiella chungangensis]